jgi:hypothetical protein
MDACNSRQKQKSYHTRLQKHKQRNPENVYSSILEDPIKRTCRRPEIEHGMDRTCCSKERSAEDIRE